MVIWFLSYALAVLVVGAVVAAAARIASWFVLDAVWLFLPGALLIFLITSDGRGRSLSNLIELPLLGVVVAFGLLARAALGRRFPRVFASAVMVPVALGATVLWYFVFPGLPE